MDNGLWCHARMLQTKADQAGQSGDDTSTTATQALAALTELQEAFIDRGIFRHLLSADVVPGGQLAEACASATFLAALSNIIR